MDARAQTGIKTKTGGMTGSSGSDIGHRTYLYLPVQEGVPGTPPSPAFLPGSRGETDRRRPAGRTTRRTCSLPRGPVENQSDVLRYGVLQALLGAAETVDESIVDKQLKSRADVDGFVVHNLASGYRGLRKPGGLVQFCMAFPSIQLHSPSAEQATIDQQGDPRYPGRIVRCKEDTGSTDVAGSAQTTDGRDGLYGFTKLLGRITQKVLHGRFDGSWADRVGGNTRLTDFHGQIARQIHDAGLAGCIGRTQPAGDTH